MRLKDQQWDCKRPALLFFAFSFCTSYLMLSKMSLNIKGLLLVLILLFQLIFIHFRVAWLKLILVFLSVFSFFSLGCYYEKAQEFSDQHQEQTLWLSGEITATKRGEAKLLNLASGEKILLEGTNVDFLEQTKVELQLRLEAFKGAMNPGGFNPQTWYYKQGILLKGSIIKIGQQKIPQGFIARGKTWFATQIKSLRQKLTEFLAQIFKGKDAAVLQALLLGDKSQLTDADRLSFKLAGMSHFIVVSGMHLNFLLLPLLFLLKNISERKKMGLMLLILLGFGEMTLWSVSVKRVVLCYVFILIGKFFAQQLDTLNILALAALFLFLNDPFIFFQIDFLLSFAATVCLVLTAVPLQAKLGADKSWMRVFKVVLATCLSMQIFFLPANYLLKNDIFLCCFIFSFPALLLVQYLVIVGFASLFVGFPLHVILPLSGQLWLEQLIEKLLFFPLKAFMGLVRMAAEQNTGRIPYGKFNAFFFLSYVVLLLILMGKLKIFPSFSLWAKKAALVALCLFCLGFVQLGLRYYFAPDWRLYFLAVGQGDACLLLAKNGQSILIDGGNVKTASRVLLPVMNELGVQTIDWAIISHGHADHAAGIMELMALGRVKHLILPAQGESAYFYKNLNRIDPAKMANAWLSVQEQFQSLDLAARFEQSFIPFPQEKDLPAKLSLDVYGKRQNYSQACIRLALAKHCRLHFWQKEETIKLDQTGDYFKVLEAGIRDLNYTADLDVNNDSLVLQLVLGRQNIYFTGDCTAKMEAVLLEKDLPACEILKVAHHGSKYSSSEEFLQKIKAKTAVISVGKNIFGHPASEVLERLENQQIKMYRTDKDGAVYFYFFKK